MDEWVLYFPFFTYCFFFSACLYLLIASVFKAQQLDPVTIGTITFVCGLLYTLLGHGLVAWLFDTYDPFYTYAFGIKFFQLAGWATGALIAAAIDS